MYFHVPFHVVTSHDLRTDLTINFFPVPSLLLQGIKTTDFQIRKSVYIDCLSKVCIYSFTPYLLFTERQKEIYGKGIYSLAIVLHII